MDPHRSRGTSIASCTSGRYGAIEQNIDDDQDRSIEHRSRGQNWDRPLIVDNYQTKNIKTMAQDLIILSTKSQKTFL